MGHINLLLLSFNCCCHLHIVNYHPIQGLTHVKAIDFDHGQDFVDDHHIVVIHHLKHPHLFHELDLDFDHLDHNIKNLLDVVVSLNINLVDCFDITNHCNLVVLHPIVDFNHNSNSNHCHHNTNLVNYINHLVILTMVLIRTIFLLVASN